MEVTIKLADIWTTVWLLTLLLAAVQIWYGFRIFDLVERTAAKPKYIRYMILNSLLTGGLIVLAGAVMIHYSN